MEKPKPLETDGRVMTLEECRAFIAAHSWKFAKTMPRWPHYYVVREKTRDDAEFLAFIRTIHRFGYDDKFGKSTHRYLCIDGFKYWTMGYTHESTIIINRADTEGNDHKWIRTERPPMRLKGWPEPATKAPIIKDSRFLVPYDPATKPVKPPHRKGTVATVATRKRVRL
jgi:hypothetical protein